MCFLVFAKEISYYCNSTSTVNIRISDNLDTIRILTRFENDDYYKNNMVLQ